MRTRPCHALRVLLPGLALIIFVLSEVTPGVRLVDAEPRFAVREGVTCVTCHVNPSGGGMRNNYGRYTYALTQLPTGYPSGGDLASMFNVDLSESLAFGADARTAFIKQMPADRDRVGLNTFFLMQADLYIAATLGDFTLYYDQGVFGSFEAFGMYRAELFSPEFSTYLKVGRFAPAYGLRLPNHNLFIREEIGFGPRDKDTGAELGIELGPVLIQGGIVNGMGADLQLDDNNEFGLIGRAEWILQGSAAQLMLGASIYSNTTGLVTERGTRRTDTRTDNFRFGGHWGFNWGRFTYLGELDFIVVEPGDDSLETATDSLRTFNNLDIGLVRGIELSLGYEFREIDLELQSGVAHRFTVGLDLFPVPLVELLTLYRYTAADGRDEQVNDGFHEIISVLHFFL